MNILLAEDDIAVRLMMRRFLSRNDERNITEAADGGEAVSMICNGERFDLIITDFNMPNADGLEVCRNAKEFQPQATVIMLSGLMCDTLAQRAISLGAHHCFEKPVEFESLERVIKSI